MRRPEYGNYQNIYDRDYAFALPAATTEVQLRNVDGDWLTLSWLAIESNVRTWKLNLVDSWGLRQSGAVIFKPDDLSAPFHTAVTLGREWLRDTCYGPWRDAQKAGLGVMIGEMGAFQHTPHAVVLRWMTDVLATAQESGFGWALWNFRGGFGVLDSNRTDITYESWEGHKLDRGMLELLQKY